MLNMELKHMPSLELVGKKVMIKVVYRGFSLSIWMLTKEKSLTDILTESY